MAQAARGRIARIARHARPRAPIEVIEAADVTMAEGIRGDHRGDHRGARRPGGSGKRQITLIEADNWAAAIAEVGHSIPWHERRCNLLVTGLDLPQRPGTRRAIGPSVILEVTRATDPCECMEALAPGLCAALTPDWRGGACARVITGGRIVIGDSIEVEEA